MSDNFTWEKSYETGHFELDEQHRWIFKTAQEIRHADKDMAIQVLEDLHKYIKEHFKQEESLMKNLKYPHSKEHLAEHKDFIKKLGEISEADKKKVASLIKKVGALMEWLRDHILEHDVKMINFYSERRNELLFTSLS